METVKTVSHVYPYARAEIITPSDTTAIPGGVCDAFYVGKTGVVVGVFDDDTELELDVCTQGEIYPFAFKRINETTTTASSLIALYYY